MHKDLIFDFGVNHGRDTEFYLLKGFRVVGVEANPLIYKSLIEQFAPYIATGQLILLNLGIWDKPGALKFYLNLENDHWSSFDERYGCRNGTRFEVIEVECVLASEVLRRFGTPYYWKIDIEGADSFVLSDIRNSDERPKFLSVEEFGVTSFDKLAELGYNKFQIVSQGHKKMVPPFPALEGNYAERVFGHQDSGLFGLELPDEWVSYEKARKYFLENIRNERFEFVGKEPDWFDIHATR